MAKKQKVISIYMKENIPEGNNPFFLIIDGKPDPLNRDFLDISDIKEWFSLMQSHGYYTEYSLDVESYYLAKAGAE